MSAPVDCEPLTLLLPDHAPEAVQLVAFAVDHDNVDDCPEVTVVGLAVNDSVGGGVVPPPPPPLAKRVEFSSKPSPPPLEMLQVWTLLPPACPKHTPTSPFVGICGRVVHEMPGHWAMSLLPLEPFAQ